jgi:hypothetical protein
VATTLYHATPYNGLIEEINLDTAANTLSNAKEYGLGFYTSYSIGNATEGGLDAGGSNMAGFLYTMEVPDEKDWGFDDSHGERFINLDKPADEAVVERLAKAFESFQGEDHNDWQIHADALRTDFSEMVARRNQMDLPYSRTENFFQIASARLKGVESNFTESDFLDRANIDFVQVNSGNLIFVNSNNLPTIKPYDSYYSSDKSGWLLHELNVNQMNGSLLLSPDVDLKMRQMIVTTSLAERNNDITAHEKLQELKQFMSEKIADMPEGISDILQKAETSTQKITADAIERARPENFNYDEMARNTVIDIHINHINDKILVSEEYQARYSELVESGHWDQSRFDNAMLKANEEFAEAFVNHPYRMDDFVDGRRVDISKGYLRDFSEFMRDANPQIQEASQEFIKQALIMRFEGSGFRHEAGKTPGLAIRVIGDDQYGNMNNALKAALKGDFHWNGFGLDDYASGGSWGHSNLKESATKLKQGIQSTIDSKPIQALDDVADLSKAAKGARAAGTIPVVGAAVGLGSAVLTNQAHAGQQDYATELHAQGILDTEALNAYNQINNKYDKLFMGDAVGGGAAEFLPVAGQVAAAIASVSIEVGAKRGFENWADIYAPNLTKEQYQTLSMSLFTADSARTEMILNAAGKLPNATDDEAFTAVVSARNSYYEANKLIITILPIPKASNKKDG